MSSSQQPETSLGYHGDDSLPASPTESSPDSSPAGPMSADDYDTLVTDLGSLVLAQELPFADEILLPDQAEIVLAWARRGLRQKRYAMQKLTRKVYKRMRSWKLEEIGPARSNRAARLDDIHLRLLDELVREEAMITDTLDWAESIWQRLGDP